MNISGLPATAQDIKASHAEQRAPRASEGHVPVPTRASDTLTTNGVRTAPRGTDAVVPSEAPPGTDPALWSVLTKEERTFFARTAGSGPLTYSKMMMPNRAPATAAPIARGGRVDIRV